MGMRYDSMKDDIRRLGPFIVLVLLSERQTYLGIGKDIAHLQ